jgi:HD-GYP domain-containing protein (c-di-GMP phosphodiesterase class II)
MLKKIPVDQLRLGMHLHALEGRWLDHPFWRARFMIDDPAELDGIRRSGVKECWIDLGRGRDTASPPEAGAPATPAPSSDEAQAPPPLPPGLSPGPPVQPQPTPTRPLAAELREAAEICQRGREAVRSMFAEARMGRTIDAAGCLPLVEEVSRSVRRNAGALVSLARLKTHDDYTYMHSVAVCALMVALARQLGLEESACREAGLAGLLHDVGKALMPGEVLSKPARLTESEWAVMRTHPERGHDLLEASGTVTGAALDVVLHHHERIDGGGYPHGLESDAISMLARMGAVCDVYDAITSNRPYKAGWDPAESIAKMMSWQGQFDAAVLGAFVHSLGIYPIGSVVRLASGRLAVVVEQNPGALLTPVVNEFFSTRADMHVEPRRVDLSRPGCRDRIGAREVGAGSRFPRLDELWADPELLRRSRR